MKFNSEIKIQYNDICKILAEYFGVNEENVELNVTDPVPPFEIEAKIIKEVEAPAKTINNLRYVPYDPPINPNLFDPWNPVIYESSVAKDITKTSVEQAKQIEDDYQKAVENLKKYVDSIADAGELYPVTKEELYKCVSNTEGSTPDAKIVENYMKGTNQNAQ